MHRLVNSGLLHIVMITSLEKFVAETFGEERTRNVLSPGTAASILGTAPMFEASRAEPITLRGIRETIGGAEDRKTHTSSHLARERVLLQ